MRRLRTALGWLAVVCLLGACGPEGPETPPQPVKPALAPRVPKPAAAKPVQQPKAPEPPFVYNPEGLRDPFQPFIKLVPEKERKKAPEVFVPKTPLQRYAVEELRLVGVVWRDGNLSRALIEDPEGKGYVVRVGTLVGDRGGKIVAIHPDKVVIEERIVDLLGEVQQHTVTLRLHTPENEVRP